MKLGEFIEDKKNELIWSGLYRDVEFISAEDVGLNKNSTMQNIISVDSDLKKDGVEVTDFSLLPEGRCVNNGSKVIFDIIPKGKRKYATKRYYFLFE